ncbi:hypothetical protein CAL29_18670 [Bordetella genomosp. 10]|uniref:histidine kinase n=1 Tax=Bordetella genomosp. 10 TaxID=1416804 RepID=A0A261RYC7_9BORD|nr:ATP-binding protein [Bordetella genomosp. 10]OZI30094.1 hypothetical protein CAL29_18670 [Bordetella genomosp. 10]
MKRALSLRARLMLMIGLSLVVLWAGFSAWMLANSRNELRAALDDRLAASAKMVAGLITRLPDGTMVDGPSDWVNPFSGSGMACSISQIRDGIAVRVISHSANSPVLGRLKDGFDMVDYGGERWRTYSIEHNGMRVTTADRVALRKSLVHEIATSIVVPFCVALAGALLALRMGIAWGLAPLERLRRVLEARTPGSDAVLPALRIPAELAPFQDTLNNLLRRVHDAFNRERQFTDAAAHELRTPLAAMKVHMQVADLALEKNQDIAVVREAIHEARTGADRMQELLDQLLELARIDCGARAGEATGVAQALRAVLNALPAAQQRRLDVDMHCTDAQAADMPEPLLVSALSNIVQNAMRHTPATARVELRVKEIAGDIEFQVLDAGPGMSRAQCAEAVRRFWRGNTASEGSGLGLAIVKAIADCHGGELSLTPRPEGGLCVRLTIRGTNAAARG